MSQQPGHRLVTEAIMIRLRAAKLEAVLVGIVAVGFVLAIFGILQAGLAGAFGRIAAAFGSVTGG
jgi:uncharacterized membrane protein